MPAVKQNEWKNFRSFLKEHGYKRRDFVVQEDTRQLHIIRKKYLFSQTYRVGENSDWLTEFKSDLVRGLFGPRAE